ncbi:MAG: hypothetical protein VX642_05570 [Bdellovibrionota bacterium]|nr:hypothetical protein [Bdellovibrionota bacterium]
MKAFFLSAIIFLSASFNLHAGPTKDQYIIFSNAFGYQFMDYFSMIPGFAGLDELKQKYDVSKCRDVLNAKGLCSEKSIQNYITKDAIDRSYVMLALARKVGAVSYYRDFVNSASEKKSCAQAVSMALCEEMFAVIKGIANLSIISMLHQNIDEQLNLALSENYYPAYNHYRNLYNSTKSKKLRKKYKKSMKKINKKIKKLKKTAARGKDIVSKYVIQARKEL